MKPNFSKLFEIVFLLALIGGSAGLSFTLVSRHLETQGKQKVEQAKNLLDREKYHEAIAAYDQLLEDDPTQSHLLWINRGFAWLGLGNYDEMLQSCSKAAKIKPQEALAWNCRGEALYSLSRPKAALESFNRALVSNPRSRLSGIILLNKGRVLADLGQYAQAVTASEQGIKLLSKLNQKDVAHDRNLGIAFNQQGQSLLKLKQNKRALIAFNQSLKFMPDDLSAQQGRGIALYRLGFYDRAVNIFTKVLQRDDLTQEQQAINWLYQGISLCQTSKVDAASQAFEQVLKLTTEPQVQAIANAGCGIR